MAAMPRVRRPREAEPAWGPDWQAYVYERANPRGPAPGVLAARRRLPAMARGHGATPLSHEVLESALAEGRGRPDRPMSQPFRLAQGGLIDRSRTLRFRFDGRALEGHAGDSLAVGAARERRPAGRAELQVPPPARHPQRRLARSRMRWCVSARAARAEPNCRATMVPLRDGLVAASQNRWPSLALDLMALNGWLSPIFPAGFYYKTFKWPAAVLDPALRAADPPRRGPGRGAAGAGSRPLREAPRRIATCWWSAAGRPVSPPRSPPAAAARG